ncbi:MAG: GYF domain-containing protein, partial [Pirellula sp.]
MTTPIEWYVKTKTGASGPFSPIQLKGFADSGKLPKTALVAKSAEGPWAMAEQIRGLFPATQEEEETNGTIQASDLVPDAVKTTAAAVGSAVTGLSKSIVSSIRNAASNLSAKVES